MVKDVKNLNRLLNTKTTSRLRVDFPDLDI